MGRKKLPASELRQLQTIRTNRQDLTSTEVRIIVEEGPNLIAELLAIINREKITIESNDYQEVFEKWLKFPIKINAADNPLRDVLLVLSTAFGKDKLKKIFKDL